VPRHVGGASSAVSAPDPNAHRGSLGSGHRHYRLERKPVDLRSHLGEHLGGLGAAAGVHGHSEGVRPRRMGVSAGITSTAKLPHQGKAMVVGLLACSNNNQDCREQEAALARVGDAAVRSGKVRCKEGRVLLVWVTSPLPFVHTRGQASSTARCVTRQEAREWQQAVPRGR
jgi:hypothetical protein